MPWIIAGGTLLSGLIGNSAASSAANAQKKASEAATAEQRREFDMARADQQPYMQQGYGANAYANRVMGGDFGAFEKSPDYQYSLGQMIQGSDRSAAARGSLYSGGHAVDLMASINGLAAQNLNNYWAKLAGQQQLGQAAAAGVGALGANMANQIGSNLNATAGAQGNAALIQGNNWQNAIGQLGSAFASSYGGTSPAAPAATNAWGAYGTTAGSPGGSWNSYGGPYG